jgi:alkanesulfonate monooxygenase SsuD/methylene tetrahydromethanopterin reductase-like flavin-dependent oxidoreductase (luciferase family)
MKRWTAGNKKRAQGGLPIGPAHFWPADYVDKYYQVQNGFSHVKPYRPEGIRILVGGASPPSIGV